MALGRLAAKWPSKPQTGAENPKTLIV